MIWTQRFLFIGVLAAIFSPLRAAAGSNVVALAAPAVTTGPPVEIDECKLLYSGNDLAGESAGVAIKFTNDSKVTADLVSFRVVAGSESGIIRDVGTFSPGIEITHHYKEGSGHLMLAPLLSHVHLDCSVASVHFTDGSVWQPSAAAGPAQTPAPAAAPTGSRGISPAFLTFGGVGKQFDQFVSVYSANGLHAVHQSGTCAGIVKTRTVDMSPLSAAVRVSPLAKGRCTITIDDAANHSIDLPVEVGSMR